MKYLYEIDKGHCNLLETKKCLYNITIITFFYKQEGYIKSYVYGSILN